MALTNTLTQVELDTAVSYEAPLGAYDDVVDVSASDRLQAGHYEDPEEEARIGAAMARATQGGAPTLATEVEVNPFAEEHARPPPPTWCKKMYMWVPVRELAFLAGLAYVVLPILTFIFGSPSFLAFFIQVLLMAFGLVTMCVELPQWPVARKVQLRVYYWARFMARTWGRAVFYLFVCLLTFAMMQESFYLVCFAAIVQVAVALMMLVVSKSAASKYTRMAHYLQAGAEGDAMLGLVSRKYDEYNQFGSGLGAAAIRKIAMDAGRMLTNAERHAIQSFLDQSCVGSVSKQDFLKRMQFDPECKWL